jgi:uncharacterized protein (TIGR01244 family)
MRRLLLVAALGPLIGCGSSEPRTVEQGVLGLGIPGAVLVEPELVSSGQYDESQFAKLPELGYHTVIQLRPATEKGTGWEEAKAQELGLTFVRIPVAGAKELTEANARKLDEALKNRHGGTLVACSSGNRVGGLFALKAFYCDGQSPEQALQAGRAAGLGRAEPEVRKLLGVPATK